MVPGSSRCSSRFACRYSHRSGHFSTNHWPASISFWCHQIWQPRHLVNTLGSSYLSRPHCDLRIMWLTCSSTPAICVTPQRWQVWLSRRWQASLSTCDKTPGGFPRSFGRPSRHCRCVNVRCLRPHALHGSIVRFAIVDPSSFLRNPWIVFVNPVETIWSVARQRLLWPPFIRRILPCSDLCFFDDRCTSERPTTAFHVVVVVVLTAANAHRF